MCILLNCNTNERSRDEGKKLKVPIGANAVQTRSSWKFCSFVLLVKKAKKIFLFSLKH
jgi:hypothetical protein